MRQPEVSSSVATARLSARLDSARLHLTQLHPTQLHSDPPSVTWPPQQPPRQSVGRLVRKHELELEL